jgi:glycosyltransferase involved in cell wall biosynthesis
MASNPRVTIGVPVYNGERFIRATVDSLLAQSYGDFELIISDNASTDGTEAICREYQGKDSRVRYIRNPRNLGPAANYNVPLDAARGELFKWNAADDVCGADFLKVCIEALDCNPDAVLAYPRTKIIDADGAFVRDYDYELDLAHPRPHVRLRRLMCVHHKSHGAHEMFGVMRKAKLILAGKKRCHVRADSIVLARMALLGKLVRVESFQFFNRDHNARSSKYLGRRCVRPNSWISGYIGVGPLPSAEWWDASLKGKIVFPEWRVMQEYYRAVSEMPLSAGDRVMCHASLTYYVGRQVPKLTRDVLIATEQAMRLPFSGRSTPSPGNRTPQAAA